MKRILIVNNNMHIGGVQKSLVNLLNEIHSKYDITLVLFHDGGELSKELPDDVKVITLSSPFRYWGMTKKDSVSINEQIKRGFWAGITRLFGRKCALRMILPFQKKLGNYDVAISFLHSGSEKVFYGGCNEFVLYCVEAAKKITFLHCDYGKINAASKYNTELYRQFDCIAACSAGCRTAFLNIMPQFAQKTVLIPNFQNYEEIRHLAQMDPIAFETDKLNIVTVCRLGKEKGVLRAIRAVANMGVEADSFRYFIVGDGIEYQEALDLISAFRLNEKIVLVGEKDNPYGYMQAADVLLIPSVSEAAPMVIGEAACLGTPILSTATSSAYEMVSETGYGWVCENSVEGIQNGIEMLLNNFDMVRNRKKYIQTLDFNNRDALKAFSKLMNETKGVLW